MRNALHHGIHLAHINNFRPRATRLEIDDELRAYIAARMPMVEISRHARLKGMISMRDHAAEKVEWGATTLEEVKRVLDL